MLRWTIRILIAFVVLIAVVAVVIHLVLQSDWLGEMVLARVSGKLGLVVDSESFSVGWGGTTAIGAATVRMPLNDELVLSAYRIELGHKVIPLLLLGRPFDLHSVKVDHPTVYLRQYESGRWNVQDAWTRLQTSLDSTARREGDAALPGIAVADARIQITEPNGATQMVGPIGFQAQRHGQLLWSFDLQMPEMANVDGRLIRGGDWAHDVGFAVQGLEPLVHQLLRRAVSPIQAKGRWNGRVLQSTVSGVIEFDQLAIGPVAMHGAARIEATLDRITVSPRGLAFSEPNVAGDEIRLTAGVVEISRKQAALRQLAVKTGTLTGRVDGAWDWDARVGAFSGSWVAALPEQPSPYYGTYQVSLKSPRAGRKEAEVTATAEAETSFGVWTIAAEARGAGAEWRQSQWQVSVPRFLWSRDERQVDMTGAAAEIGLSWPEVRLTSLHVPNAEQVDANAVFDMTTRQWSARFAAQDWRLEELDVNRLNLTLAAAGDDRQARVSELRVAAGARVVTGQGEFSFAERGLQDFRLSADWPAGSPAPPPQARQSLGRWHLEADLTGRVYPVALEVQGALTGQNISFGKKRVDRVAIPLRAKATAREVHVAAEPFSLLGGKWQLSGRHDLSSELTELNLVANDLSLAAAAEMAGLPLTSRGQAHAEIQLAMPGLELQRAVATGSWSAQDINIPPLRAAEGRGALRISGGLVRFEDIRLQQEGGQAHASMEFRLEEPQTLFVELKTEAWPVRFEDHGLVVLADGQAKLQVNVVTKSARGEAQAENRILWDGHDLARLRLVTLVAGQTLDVRELYAQTLGGSVEGMARIPLDHWTRSVAQLHWQGIQLKQLERWVPQCERFQGAMSGSLVVDQVDGQARAPEPMRLVLDADIAEGRFGPAEVEVCHVIGYLGADRLLIDEAGFQVLGGQLGARARVSTHAGGYFASLVTDFNDLNLDQLVHVIDPNAGEYAGLLSGDATILSSSDRLSLGGQAKISLAQSDLLSNSVVGTLYNTLNLRFGKQQSTGTGEIDIRLEGPSVRIPSFMYFNRGVEIRGAGEIADVSLGAKSPVDGYAVASTRVLKGIALPGVDAMDRLLTTFQTGTASVKIGGTLDNVEVNVVPLPVVLGSFRRLLWAQLRP